MRINDPFNYTLYCSTVFGKGSDQSSHQGRLMK